MRKKKSRSPDLTSLLDVLFVVLFCVLIGNYSNSENNIARKEKEIERLENEIQKLNEDLKNADDKKMAFSIDSGEYIDVSVKGEEDGDLVIVKEQKTGKSLRISLQDSSSEKVRREKAKELEEAIYNETEKTGYELIIYKYDGDISRRRNIDEDGIVTMAVENVKKRLKKDFGRNIIVMKLPS